MPRQIADSDVAIILANEWKCNDSLRDGPHAWFCPGGDYGKVNALGGQNRLPVPVAVTALELGWVPFPYRIGSQVFTSSNWLRTEGLYTRMV